MLVARQMTKSRRPPSTVRLDRGGAAAKRIEKLLQEQRGARLFQREEFRRRPREAVGHQPQVLDLRHDRFPRDPARMVRRMRDDDERDVRAPSLWRDGNSYPISRLLS